MIPNFNFNREHKKTHRHEKPRNKAQSYVCEECGKVCRSLATLDDHKRFHSEENPLQCKECGNVLASLKTLRDHIATHQPARPYMCEHCGMSFKSSSTLKHHYQIHAKVPLFQCPFCDKRFRGFHGRKNHMVQEHGDRKNNHRWRVHTCDYCNKSFGAKQQLTLHIATHTGNRPYTCDICSKTFVLKSVLDRHKRHHTLEKKFNCYVCNSSFFIVSKIKRHMKTASHLQLCSDMGVNPEGNLQEYLQALEEDRLTKTVVTIGMPSAYQIPKSTSRKSRGSKKSVLSDLVPVPQVPKEHEDHRIVMPQVRESLSLYDLHEADHGTSMSYGQAIPLAPTLPDHMMQSSQYVAIHNEQGEMHYVPIM